MKNFNRRDFLKLGTASIVGSGLLNFPQMTYAQEALGDYKALVCVFMHGGNDGFNLIVPTDNDSYAEYAQSRQNLAVAQNSLLPINPLSTNGRTFGLHPSAAPLQSLFADGNMAIMGNVGHLKQPTTRDMILNKTAILPTELFSHNNQQEQWKTVNLDNNLLSGWGGRIANTFADTQAEPLLTGISMNSRSPWLRHPENIDLAISADGFDEYWYVSKGVGYENKRRTAYLETIYKNYNNAFRKQIADTQKRTLELVESVGGILKTTPQLTTVFPEDNGYGLASQLKTVANMIAARDALGMSRQIFFVEMGGFDTHDNQNRDQPLLFNTLSQSLKAFYDALVEVGASSEVTTFTASEFGRTLSSNGDGTDHAWGNHQLVIGDAVRGGDIYGAMPSLAIGGVDDYKSRGRIIPTSSVEQYVQSMLSWYGLTPTQIQTVLPNHAAFDLSKINLMI
jgi:uncharacterized protein (DUF1501 family)